MTAGKVLSGRRVKTNQIYTIPVTPKLEALIKKWVHYLGNHLWMKT